MSDYYLDTDATRKIQSRIDSYNHFINLVLVLPESEKEQYGTALSISMAIVSELKKLKADLELGI